jgi:hypothetical protein
LNGEGSGRTCAGAIAAASPFFGPFSSRSLSLSISNTFWDLVLAKNGKFWDLFLAQKWQFLRPRFGQVLGPRFSPEMASFKTSFWPIVSLSGNFRTA